jgi:hypothetical protein
VTGIRVALVACVAMSVLAGVASALRGKDRRRQVDTRASDVAVAVEPV